MLCSKVAFLCASLFISLIKVNGDYTFSAQLHELNSTENCPSQCEHYMYFLREFGAPVPTQNVTGNYTSPIDSDYILSTEDATAIYDLLNRTVTFYSNSKWMGRIQFYVVLINNVESDQSRLAALDHILIDLELDPGPDFTSRKSYFGIYNITQFDMSFRVECSENYYGSDCTTLCVDVEGQYSCDYQGNLICDDNGRDPTANCTKCLTDQNPFTNCSDYLPDRNLSHNNFKTDSGFIAGVTTGAFAAVSIVVFSIIFIVIACKKLKKSSRKTIAVVDDGDLESNPIYGDSRYRISQLYKVDFETITTMSQEVHNGDCSVQHPSTAPRKGSLYEKTSNRHRHHYYENINDCEDESQPHLHDSDSSPQQSSTRDTRNGHHSKWDHYYENTSKDYDQDTNTSGSQPDLHDGANSLQHLSIRVNDDMRHSKWDHYYENMSKDYDQDKNMSQVITGDSSPSTIATDNGKEHRSRWDHYYENTSINHDTNINIHDGDCSPQYPSIASPSLNDNTSNGHHSRQGYANQRKDYENKNNYYLISSVTVSQPSQPSIDGQLTE